MYVRHVLCRRFYCHTVWCDKSLSHAASFLFEDLGASAYIGALSLITNSTYRTVAAQIGATEAYHSSLVRTLLYQIIDTTPAYNSTVRQITDAIVAVENKISGAPQLKYQLYNQQGSSIANVDSNGKLSVFKEQSSLIFTGIGLRWLMSCLYAQLTLTVRPKLSQPRRHVSPSLWELLLLWLSLAWQLLHFLLCRYLCYDELWISSELMTFSGFLHNFSEKTGL